MLCFDMKMLISRYFRTFCENLQILSFWRWNYSTDQLIIDNIKYRLYVIYYRSDIKYKSHIKYNLTIVVF